MLKSKCYEIIESAISEQVKIRTTKTMSYKINIKISNMINDIKTRQIPLRNTRMSEQAKVADTAIPANQQAGDLSSPSQ